MTTTTNTTHDNGSNDMTNGTHVTWHDLFENRIRRGRVVRVTDTHVVVRTPFGDIAHLPINDVTAA